MKLRSKFFIIFFLLSTIPVLIITVVVYDYYSTFNEQRMQEMHDRIFDSATEEANESIADLKHTFEMLDSYGGSDVSIIEDLKKYAEEGTYSYLDIYHSNKQIRLLAQNLILSSEHLNGIFIFTPSGVTLGYGQNLDVKPNYNPKEDYWYTATLQQKGGIYTTGIDTKDFLLTKQESLSFSRAIYDVYTHEFLGVILVDYSPTFFNIERINPLSDTVHVSIETDYGEILYSNESTLAEPLPEDISLLETHETSLNMKGLVLKTAANPTLLYQNFTMVKSVIILLAILYVILFVVISMLLSHSLTTPIALLCKKMAHHKLHTYATEEKYLRRSDEIGTLYNEYNSMLDEQSTYIKNEYQNKLITLDSQMKSLESQINSHFLYNTLESVNSLAELHGVDSISQISIALGNMLRYSIKAKSELVCLSEEMANVWDYVAIQQIRFEDKFTLHLNIPEEMYSLKVLKLIFQPIVENALLHGLLHTSKGGTISIHGSYDKNFLYFDISDNGSGMDEEQLLSIQNALKEKPHFKELGKRSTQSIGLSNINSRIELYYGSGYGLQITSELHQGTTVSIKVPNIT